MLRLARRALSTASRRSPYDVLGVHRGCSSADLKKAYLKRAMQFHPDRNPEDETADQKFKAIADAYNVLSQITSRAVRSPGAANRESAEELFWRLNGLNGKSPARAEGWRTYAKAVDGLDDSHIISGFESRSLYRELLRELRGVEADASACVRDTAREKLCESSRESSAERIRCLLIDGRHQLDTLRGCLGTAIIRPEWALRPGVHITRAQVEQGHASQPGLAAAHACSLAQKEEKERLWAAFVETKLRPAFEAFEETRQARAAIGAAGRSTQARPAIRATARRSPGAGAVAALAPGGHLQRYCRGLATAVGPETPEAAIRRLHAVMLEAADNSHETFVPTVGDDGMLVVDLGDKGQYSFQEHNGQLILFSPVSGPCYYAFDGGNRWWTDPNDGHLLDEKLVREMMHITSVYLNL